MVGEQREVEFVLLSGTTLRFLALDDPVLKRVFCSVVPSDRLPRKPSRTTRAAYILKTDLVREHRRNCLALWTEHDVCEVLDSYGLPLTAYDAPRLLEWLDHWLHLLRSEQTLQALNSGAC